MNVGYRPIARAGVPALEWSRLSHVYQNYFRPETIGPANAPMVARQAGIPLAAACGGGMVAAVDGMRFVVPVPALFARPNRKFFGPERGMTWLNAMNDQGMGRGAKVVSGTVRDWLHMVDVIFGLDGGELPEIVVSDTHSYSDLIFGILQLLGISYRPALADLPDQKQLRSIIVAGDTAWTDVAVDLDVCMMRGVDKGVVVRVMGESGTGVDLRGGSYQDVVMYQGSWPMGRATTTNANGTWNHLRVEARGSRYRVFVNGEQRLDKNDGRSESRGDPHSAKRFGRIALPAYTGGVGQCTVYYDNVVVTALK